MWVVQTSHEFAGNYFAKNGVELNLFGVWFVQTLREFIDNYFAKMV